MDNVNDFMGESTPANNESKNRNRQNANSDIVVRVEAGNSVANNTLTRVSTAFIIGLIGLSALQCYQTKVLNDQNAALLAQLQSTDEKYGKLLDTYEETIKSYGDTLDMLEDKIVGAASVTPGASVPEAPAVEETQEKAIMGISVATDGSAQTMLGLRILGVYESSPAHLAGLRGGDIIMSLDDVDMVSYEALSAVLDAKKPGDTVVVKYAHTDNNTVYFFEVTLELTSSSNFNFDESQLVDGETAETPNP